MPRIAIDYSNTVIYKIVCKDESITDLYVGHTTNFSHRKNIHKTSCINNNSNKKIYKRINEMGGWDNWEMLIIDRCICKDSTEARMKEQEWTDKLKANLNSMKAYLTPEETEAYYKKGSEWYGKNLERAKLRYKTICDKIETLEKDNMELKAQLISFKDIFDNTGMIIKD